MKERQSTHEMNVSDVLFFPSPVRKTKTKHTNQKPLIVGYNFVVVEINDICSPISL